MIEESLLRSNFVGRDGFRWWVGSVAPFDGEGQSDQNNGGGWGNRTKVRIMGYHPFDEEELSNEDLPWAQILLPTTAGSGAGNMAQNTKLRPSDSVFGFFLDGDNAQLPVVVGVFGRTSEVSDNKYVAPFAPFTGYTGRIEEPDGSTLAPSQSNENNTQSQKSPRDVPKEVIDEINANIDGLNAQLPENTPKFWKEVQSYTGIGKKVPLANTCEDTTIGSIIGIVNNLFDAVTGLGSGFINTALEISKSVRAITVAAGNIVGNMFTKLASALIPILNEGLGGLFNDVVSGISDATDALLAGVGAQASFLEPIGFLQEALLCGVGNITNQLPEMIEGLLDSVLENAKNFVSCVGTQFAGSLVNDIISRVEGFMGPILEIVGGLLGEGLDIVGILTSGVDAISNIASIFECGQSTEKCDGMVKEYVIGKGVIDAVTDVSEILENVKISREIGNVAVAIGTDINKKLEEVGLIEEGAESGLPECDTNLSFGFPEVKIFGGSAKETVQIIEETEEGPITVEVPNEEFEPAVAAAQLGGFVKNADGRITASIVGVKLYNPGRGYKHTPFVEIVDPSRKGYGALARAQLNTDGSIKTITMVSIGENYPIGDTKVNDRNLVTTVPGGGNIDDVLATSEGRRKNPRVRNSLSVGVGSGIGRDGISIGSKMNLGIASIGVYRPGDGYSSDDIITDPFDIPYNIAGTEIGIAYSTLAQGVYIIPTTPYPEFRIRSETGSGAILKPIIVDAADVNISVGYTPGRLIQIIDCI